VVPLDQFIGLPVEHGIPSMPESDLTKLRRARSRCHLKLKQAEALVAGYQAKLTDLEARIRAIAPELELQGRFRKPNPIFARGELPRLALEVMREEGKPLPVAVIVRRMLAAKGVTLPGPGTVKRTKTKLHNALIALDRRGVTMKVGSGRATRRGLTL
jgi:hypothetical protein